MVAPSQGQRRHGRLPRAQLAAFSVLGGWVVLVSALLARLGVDNRYVFRDEANAIALGRDMAHDPSLILTGSLARGPERMTSLFAAVAATLTGEPVRQVELLHLWTAACEGLVAVPVWLAARTLGLGRWQALVPATLASAGSFASYGIFTLNAAVGTLTAALLLWAMVRALARPGAASDLLVVAALALLALSRIGWAPLVAALAPAALATLWFERPTGEGVRHWLRALPRRLAHHHPLLTPLALLLLAAMLADGSSPLVGGHSYGGVRLHPHIVSSVLWQNTRLLGAHLAIGVALVPLVLALPMLARGLVRPATPTEGGFAWLVVGMALVFSYAYYLSMNEDRYFAVLAAPLVLAAALAAFRRPPPVGAVLVSGVLVVALLAKWYDSPAQGSFAYFIDPTSRFYADVVVGRMTQRLPGASELWATLSAAAAVAGAVWVVATARHGQRLGRTGLAGACVVLAGTLAFQLAAMDHPARKFTQLAGMRSLSAAQLEAFDHASGGAPVRLLAVDGIVNRDLDAQLPTIAAYNATLSPTPLSVATPDAMAQIPGQARIDPRSGRIETRDPPAVVIQMAGAARIGIAGTVLPPREPFPWARLVRTATPLRAEWTISGTTVGRYPLPGTPVRIRAFPAHAPHRCLRGRLFVHPLADGPARYRLSDGRHVRASVLRPSAPQPFSVPLSATRPIVVTLSGQARRLATGESRGPSAFDVTVGSCRHRWQRARRTAPTRRNRPSSRLRPYTSRP